MTIGILIDYAISGGLQTAAIQEAKSLIKLGHQASIIVLSRSHLSPLFNQQAHPVPLVFLQPYSLKIPLFSFLSTAHFLSPFIAPFILTNFDLIISHNSTTTFTALALKLTRRIPYVAIVHDPLPYTLKKVYPKIFSLITPLVSFLEWLTLKQAAKIVIDSLFHQNLITNLYHITAHVVPLGVLPPPRPLSKLGNHILATSRWQKEKHPELLLKLLSQLPAAKLIIAGSWTKDLDWFKQVVASTKLTSRVKIITDFPETARARLYKQARVWVHPNLEAFGLDCLLAASYGIPVIMPPGSGATTILKQSLSPALLQKILTNHTFALQLGRQALKTVTHKYTWAAHTQRLLP